VLPLARRLLRTVDSIATPCSVNTLGMCLRPPHDLEVPNWNLKFSRSTGVSTNEKSAGKREAFLETALFRIFVSTHTFRPGPCRARRAGRGSDEFALRSQAPKSLTQ